MSWKDILKEKNEIKDPKDYDILDENDPVYELPAHLIRRCRVCGRDKHLLEFSAKPGDSSRPHDDWQFRTTCNECEEKMQ